MKLLTEEWVIIEFPKDRTETVSRKALDYIFRRPEDALEAADYLRRIHPLSRLEGKKISTWAEEEEFEV